MWSVVRNGVKCPWNRVFEKTWSKARRSRTESTNCNLSFFFNHSNKAEIPIWGFSPPLQPNMPTAPNDFTLSLFPLKLMRKFRENFVTFLKMKCESVRVYISYQIFKRMWPDDIITPETPYKGPPCGLVYSPFFCGFFIPILYLFFSRIKLGMVQTVVKTCPHKLKMWILGLYKSASPT